jgi:hypothetical protein
MSFIMCVELVWIPIYFCSQPASFFFQPSYEDKDDQPKMCFNGAKSWFLGWYDDRHKKFDPLTDVILIGAKMVALDDYLTGKTTSAHAVVLKIVTDATEADDYYVMYNRAKGVNEEVQEYADQVTITKGREREPSYHVGHLSSGPTNTKTLLISNKTMVVELCGFYTEYATGAEYAMINVYDGSLPAPLCPAQVPPPTPVPAPAPVPAPTPSPIPPHQPMPGKGKGYYRPMPGKGKGYYPIKKGKGYYYHFHGGRGHYHPHGPTKKGKGYYYHYHGGRGHSHPHGIFQTMRTTNYFRGHQGNGGYYRSSSMKSSMS